MTDVTVVLGFLQTIKSKLLLVASLVASLVVRSVKLSDSFAQNPLIHRLHSALARVKNISITLDRHGDREETAEQRNRSKGGLGKCFASGNIEGLEELTVSLGACHQLLIDEMLIPRMQTFWTHSSTRRSKSIIQAL